MNKLTFTGTRDYSKLGQSAEIIIKLIEDPNSVGENWERFDGAEGTVTTIVDGTTETVDVYFNVQIGGDLIEVFQHKVGHLFSLQGLRPIQSNLTLELIGSASNYQDWDGEVSLS